MSDNSETTLKDLTAAVTRLASMMAERQGEQSVDHHILSSVEGRMDKLEHKIDKVLGMASDVSVAHSKISAQDQRITKLEAVASANSHAVEALKTWRSILMGVLATLVAPLAAFALTKIAG